LKGRKFMGFFAEGPDAGGYEIRAHRAMLGRKALLHAGY
jgi:hypothetical protein